MKILKSDVLREARCGMKLTQDELAKKIGISRQTLNKIENGREIPNLVILAKMLHVLKLKFDDVINKDYLWKYKNF
jgi:putative transcriptional regulator